MRERTRKAFEGIENALYSLRSDFDKFGAIASFLERCNDYNLRGDLDIDKPLFPIERLSIGAFYKSQTRQYEFDVVNEHKKYASTIIVLDTIKEIDQYPQYQDEQKKYFTSLADQSKPLDYSGFDNAIDLVNKIGEHNAPMMRYNEEVVNLLIAFLSGFGLPTTVYVVDHHSRQKIKPMLAQTAEWVNELKKFKTNSSEWNVEYSTKQIQELRKAFTAKYDVILKERAEAKKIEEQKERKESLEREKIFILAQCQLMYGLEPSEVQDIDECVEFLLSKNNLLRLAYAMEQTRNDWSEGYYRVENALSSFQSPLSERDRKIFLEIQSLLNTDDLPDGRVFRDCEHNYSELYAIVEEEHPDIMALFNRCQRVMCQTI